MGNPGFSFLTMIRNIQGALWEVHQTVTVSSTRKNKENPYIKLVAILEIEEGTGSWNIQIYKNS